MEKMWKDRLGRTIKKGDIVSVACSYSYNVIGKVKKESAYGNLIISTYGYTQHNVENICKQEPKGSYVWCGNEYSAEKRIVILKRPN